MHNLDVYGPWAKQQVHIGKVSSACFFHLRRLYQLHCIICTSMMQRLVSAFVLPRIDYCNSVSAELLNTTLLPLLRTMNAAVRLVAGLGPHDSVTAPMKKLQWLPIAFRTNTNSVYWCMPCSVGFCSEYISKVLIPVSVFQAVLCCGLLRPTHLMFNVLWWNSQRAFSVAGPAAWNNLSPSLKTDYGHLAIQTLP